jgi:hypothetical protein
LRAGPQDTDEMDVITGHTLHTRQSLPLFLH